MSGIVGISESQKHSTEVTCISSKVSGPINEYLCIKDNQCL